MLIGQVRPVRTSNSCRSWYPYCSPSARIASRLCRTDIPGTPLRSAYPVWREGSYTEYAAEGKRGLRTLGPSKGVELEDVWGHGRRYRSVTGVVSLFGAPQNVLGVSSQSAPRRNRS